MTPVLFRVIRADLRHAFRACVAHRLVAAVVISVTALAIGGVTAIGGVITRVLLDPLPFPEPARLMRVSSINTKTGHPMPTPYAVYDEWRQRNRSFADLAAFSHGRPTLKLHEGAEPFDVAFVGETLPRVLGITPLVGRAFEPHEFQEGRGDVLLLTHDAWRRMYQEDPAVLGMQIPLDDHVYTIIGVLPPTTFEYPQSPFPSATDAWLPLVRSGATIALPTANTGDAVTVVGRLMPGVTPEQAQADARSVAAAIAAEHTAHRDRSVDVVPLSEVTTAGPRPTLFLVVAALVMVLGIACVNIANLLLARTEARRRDFAIMAAVGATRGGLARQLLLENLLLALSGASLGLMLSPFLLRAFVALYPDPLPRPVGSDVIVEVVPLAIVIAVLTSVLASLPLLATIRSASIADLGTDDRTHTASAASLRLRAGLMVAQLAMSLVLLTTAASLTRTFVALSTASPGYDDSVMAFAMGMVERDRAPERARQFYTELFDTLARQPGVVGVAMTNSLPTRGGMMAQGVRFFDGDGDSVANARQETPPMAHVVTPSLARVLSMHLLRGRDLDETDGPGSVPVALLNERLARVVYGSLDVTGRHFDWGGRTWQIVGVINNVRQRGPSEDVDPAFYVSWKQHAALPVFVLVRSSLDGQALATTIRTAVSTADRDRIAPIHTMATLADRATDLTRRERFRALTTSAISVLSLALVVMGIYGTMAYAVSQRRQEIAIRLALGDSGRRIQRRFIGQAMVLSTVGAALGLLGTVATSRWLESLIAGLVVRDALMGVVTAVLLVIIAIIAAWSPAHAASRVDPATLLKGH